MKLMYVQPVLTSYRKHVLEALLSRFDVLVVSEDASAIGAGFESGVRDGVRRAEAPMMSLFGGSIVVQPNAVKQFFSWHPEVVVCCANPRDLSFWALLVFGRLTGRRVYAHGQGAFAHPSPGLVRRLMYKTMVSLCYRYVCYTELSARTLAESGSDRKKLVVAENSISLLSEVAPHQRNYLGPGVLFIGRLRNGCRLAELIYAIKQLRSDGYDITLDVVGGGELEAQFRSTFSQVGWITWHGSVYDDAQISRISTNCRVGCYPGDAGLSIVHYMGLSLPPLVHSSFSQHMGPEPSYIVDGVNGFFFSRDDGLAAIEGALRRVFDMSQDAIGAIAGRAYSTYRSLNSPGLGKRLLDILEESSDGV